MTKSVADCLGEDFGLVVAAGAAAGPVEGDGDDQVHVGEVRGGGQAAAQQAAVEAPGSEVAVMVNGLGGTPLMEQYILYDEVENILREKGIRIYKAFVGNYMTSLEMAGVSVTLLKLDDELKAYLDYPSEAPAFRV
jgi:dihydroxyacetone kinase